MYFFIIGDGIHEFKLSQTKIYENLELWNDFDYKLYSVEEKCGEIDEFHFSFLNPDCISELNDL
jgi:hypothetical protein